MSFLAVGCGDDSSGSGGSGGSTSSSTSTSEASSTSSTSSAATTSTATTSTASSGQGGSGGAGAGGSASNPDPCDTVAQDCTVEPETKCSAGLADDGSIDAHCSEPLGDATLGEDCVRPDGVVGQDTCAAGLFCSFLDSTSVDARTCHAHCASGQGCPVDQVCLGIGSATEIGLCAGACGPSIAGGGCVPGGACAFGIDVEGVPILFCSVAGPLTVGETCTGNGDCGADLTCVYDGQGTNPTCQPYCDDANLCPVGTACVLLSVYGDGDFPADLGFCREP